MTGIEWVNLVKVQVPVPPWRIPNFTERIGVIVVDPNAPDFELQIIKCEDARRAFRTPIFDSVTQEREPIRPKIRTELNSVDFD
jgi:hypothetical protein